MKGNALLSKRLNASKLRPKVTKGKTKSKGKKK